MAIKTLIMVLRPQKTPKRPKENKMPERTSTPCSEWRGRLPEGLPRFKREVGSVMFYLWVTLLARQAQSCTADLTLAVVEIGWWRSVQDGWRICWSAWA